MWKWLGGIVLSLCSVPVLAAGHCASSWPLWEGFAASYIQSDGRVIDHGAGEITTSEGQSYALFFSLVANDREHFARILKWTENNLAQGNMREYLPAWKWGKRKDGAWTVLDDNSASDADMWIAYALLHAAADWKMPAYRTLGLAVMHNVARREVADLPGLGSMLLPGPYGFAVNATTWKLNPSYMPPQLLRYFSTLDRSGPWRGLLDNMQRMIAAVSVHGAVPDWLLYSVKDGFTLGAEADTGYDAIRVYLWWAMLSPRDPLFAALRPYLSGVPQFAPASATLPERIDVRKGSATGTAPLGFRWALAPYRYVLYRQQPAGVPQPEAHAGYYNYVLSLFGAGWMAGRFTFEPDGGLKISWCNPRAR